MSFNFEREVREQREELQRSMKFQIDSGSTNGVNEDLSKGITDDLKYSSNKDAVISVRKKGSELKEKLIMAMKISEKEKDQLLEKMEECVEDLGIAPTGKMDNYSYTKYKNVIKVVPKKYAYDQMYKEVGKMGSGEYPMDQKANSVSEEDRNLMYKYNNLASRFIDESIEVLKIGTTIGAIVDSKTYNLNIDLATKLGF